MVGGLARLALWLGLALAAAGCTTIGVSVPGSLGAVDFGPRQELRVCLLREPSVSEARARSLVAAVNREFADYRIEVTVPWIREWQRPGFGVQSIIRGVADRPLEPPCDRLVGLVGRTFLDFALGLVLPETLGAVERATHTRGFLAANYGSINQLLSPPPSTAQHEFHHLLGCVHALTRGGCYREIARLKRAHASSAEDFFPGATDSGEPILARRDVEARLRPGEAPQHR